MRSAAASHDLGRGATRSRRGTIGTQQRVGPCDVAAIGTSGRLGTPSESDVVGRVAAWSVLSAGSSDVGCDSCDVAT